MTVSGTQQVDVVVIGLGPGGEYAAQKFAEAGLSVVGVEKAWWGASARSTAASPRR